MDTNSPLHPLAAACRHASRSVPRIDSVTANDMPEPYRSLLVHDGDMTPTLVRFHQSDIHLNVLQQFTNYDNYGREVVLLLDGADKPVEYGAIIVMLGRFPKRARDQILGGYRPLGAILAEHNMVHTSAPTVFFSVLADDHIANVLDVTAGTRLFGRCNVISNEHGQPLADIVEILPLTPL